MNNIFPLFEDVNLYLVGMMGTGKTTLGRQLANRLDCHFLDTDALAEQIAGQEIAELFAKEGEGAFRVLETQVLSQVSARTQTVVATGGGIVTQPTNWTYLRRGLVIWLDVPISELAVRLSGDTTRPLLKDTVALTTKLETLMAERRAHYARADIHIVYKGTSVDQTCDLILTAIQQSLKEISPASQGSLLSNG